MFSHLKEKGWLEMSHEQIIEELHIMWKKIEADGILSGTGLTYQHFVSKALEAQRIQEIIGIFRRASGK